MGSRLNNHFEYLFDHAGLQPIKNGNNYFFWKQGHDAASYDIYRTAVNDPDKRDADDLPADEIANAVKDVLKNQVSLLQSDLVRETAKLFGFARVGGNVENAMVLGIAKAIDKGFAKWSGERVVYGG